MTAKELQVIQWAIEALELKPNYTFRVEDPQTSAKVIYLLKGLFEKYNKKALAVKQETQVQKFVRLFGDVYLECTGQPYKTDRKHFILITKLIKQYGFEAVYDKAQLLAFYCRDARVWFVKDGWATFTIETLSNRWNNILPQRRLSPEEIKDQKYKNEAKKWEEHDAAINQALNKPGKGPDQHGDRTPACTPGPAIDRDQAGNADQ